MRKEYLSNATWISTCDYICIRGIANLQRGEVFSGWFLVEKILIFERKSYLRPTTRSSLEITKLVICKILPAFNIPGVMEFWRRIHFIPLPWRSRILGEFVVLLFFYALGCLLALKDVPAIFQFSEIFRQECRKFSRQFLYEERVKIKKLVCLGNTPRRVFSQWSGSENLRTSISQMTNRLMRSFFSINGIW